MPFANPRDCQKHSNSGLIAMALWLKLLAQRLRKSKFPFLRGASVPLAILYRAISLYLVGFDIPTSVKMGRGVVIYHGIGLVVNDRAVIGDSVILRQNTSIAAINDHEPAPIVSAGVDVGANVVILGPITIGRGAVIGAGSVVVRDVPAGVTVVGNPARQLEPSTCRKVTESGPAKNEK